MKPAFPSVSSSLTVFRIVVALLLAAHGFIRLYAGTVDGFGDFLTFKGFPAGNAVAWFLTIFEIAGGLCMAAGFFVKWIALVLMTEIIMGIILVHAANGWFVVGHQLGGVEYSVLLIFSLLLIIAQDISRKNKRSL
ncbi:MAG TPA: DoxX family protein [Chitinophagaceae bacterium]|nr:DoxX family protein [Chitinophagaceae bacterium]